MYISFLLHLYQPSFQSKESLLEIVNSSYLPLLRYFKNRKKVKISLSLPLSALEILDTSKEEACKEVLEGIKELVNSGQIELVGGAAYHPLLTKLPQEFIEKQIVLNEYGLGYYFGRHSDFEGSSAILLKDVNGFFPPELAVNKNLINTLGNLGYSWTLVDSVALKVGSKQESPESAIKQPPKQNPLNKYDKHSVFRLKDSDNSSVNIIRRSTRLSNLISFKRSSDISDIRKELDRLSDLGRESLVVSLDAEFFGHHFDDGLLLLDDILEEVWSRGLELLSVSDLVEETDIYDLDDIRESSWGVPKEASKENMDLDNPYPNWVDKDNKVQMLQWEIFNEITKYFKDLVSESLTLEGFETLPVWLRPSLEKVPGDDLKKRLELDILVNKSLNSDQFWWSSGNRLCTGQILYDPEMIRKSLRLYREVAEFSDELELILFVKEKTAQIESLL